MFVPVTWFLSLCSTLWEGICCPQVLQVWFLSVLFLPFWSLFSILWMRKQEFKLIKEFPKVTEGPCGHRGWDGWMASLTQWTWVRANSGKWRKGKTGMLQSMGLQRAGHDWMTEQQQQGHRVVLWDLNSVLPDARTALAYPTLYNTAEISHIAPAPGHPQVFIPALAAASCVMGWTLPTTPGELRIKPSCCRANNGTLCAPKC